MALYHFHLTQIKRSEGKTAMAAAAYRAGEKLHSDYYGFDYDYTRKSGVVHTEIMLPPHAPKEYADRKTLWDAVEKAERGKKAQLAHSFDIALQTEFSMEENIALARQFVSEQLVARGMIADLGVHLPDKDDVTENPHFHVMCPIRPLNPDGTWGLKQRREYVLDEHGNRIEDMNGNYVFNAVPTTNWSQPKTLEEMRQAWAEMCNRRFEAKGFECRIDHRSYERQGIEQVPTTHEGPNVRKMEAKGIQTEKGKLNRWIRNVNRSFANLKARLAALLEALDAIIEEQRKARAKFEAENIATLLNTYYRRRNAGAYSSKARTNNLQDEIDAFEYLQAKGIDTLDDLKVAVQQLGERVTDKQTTIRDRQARIKEIDDLLTYAENYKRLKPLYDEMNGIRWKKKREQFRQDHEGELKLFYLARRKLNEARQGDEPLPLAEMKKEQAALIEKNKSDYASLKNERTEFLKLQKIKANLESALRSEPERSREPDR